jgi:hypothetical protein
LRHLVTGEHTLDSPVGGLIESDYATVTPDTKIELLQGVLADAKVAIVTEREEVKGIITKIDLIDFLARGPQGPASGTAPLPPAASARAKSAARVKPNGKKPEKKRAAKASHAHR